MSGCFEVSIQCQTVRFAYNSSTIKLFPPPHDKSIEHSIACKLKVPISLLTYRRIYSLSDTIELDPHYEGKNQMAHLVPKERSS